ncbi:hypothetical protein WMY93_011383 [Mugilogobius chulae]|uniref:Uncharacterized protein n=1 Tax=Mugilogobius chulae TaxID=88201 RepID=A0AAW0PB92_9GOBI
MPEASRLEPLLAQYDLRLVCDQCSVKEKEITYKYIPKQHQCALNLLLCRAKGGSHWRPVSKRPTFPNPSQYQVCYHFREGSGCSVHRNRCSFARSLEEAAPKRKTLINGGLLQINLHVLVKMSNTKHVTFLSKAVGANHGKGCTFARSSEEAAVWNHVRNNQMQVKDLMRQIAEASIKTPEETAQDIMQQFPGQYKELCTECFFDQPAKLAVKKWNDTCSADVAHKWKPLLFITQLSKAKSSIRFDHFPKNLCSSFAIMSGRVSPAGTTLVTACLPE